MEKTKETTYAYLSQRPGIQLIKAGSPEMIELNDYLGIPSVKSQIIDIPITHQLDALTTGRFAMQSSCDFEFEYAFLEIKVVVSGKIVVRDTEGNRYEGHVGDIFVFTPPFKVIFDGESDGVAVYAAHRSPEPAFM
ncbi:hypothetical protein [Ammoniphilus sp. 3BR4]|uniref:hypothetical protein n=1 Tax=Ammoniphilus sp. 3BR4 TaxID=3158265 RepID=UPI0034653C0B